VNQKQRILIVDDEPQITRVLRMGLSTRGYDVRTAADGESAFDTFNDWHPDLVLTDLSMPNMGGLELCKRLRLISQIPVIVLSVKGEEKIKVEALDAGADDYVTKPFSMDELLARDHEAIVQRVIAVCVEGEREVAAVARVLIPDCSLQPLVLKPTGPQPRHFHRAELVEEGRRLAEVFDHEVRHALRITVERSVMPPVWPAAAWPPDMSRPSSQTRPTPPPGASKNDTKPCSVADVSL